MPLQYLMSPEAKVRDRKITSVMRWPIITPQVPGTDVVPKNKKGHYKTLTATASTPCCNVQDYNCCRTHCTIHTLLHNAVIRCFLGSAGHNTPQL